MKAGQVVAAARSPAGRIVTGGIGLGLVLLIVRGIGFSAVAASLAGAALLFPVVVALEVVALGCSLGALRALYRPAKVPLAQLVRAGLIGYAVMGLAPAGRAVAEVARASMLSPYVGVGRASAAATRIQGAALLGNALISIPAALAAVLASAHGGVPWWLWALIAGNGIGTAILGLSVLVATRAGVGAWLGRKVPKAQKFGAGLDEALAGERLLPLRSIGWELLGRVFQVVQCGVLLACVGAVPTPVKTLIAEGTLLVGAALGDLVPGQLGAIEGFNGVAASALGIPAASAVAMALLFHLSQLFWVVVGTLVSVAWPASADRKERIAIAGSIDRRSSSLEEKAPLAATEESAAP